jgi:hypothetical protein
MSPNPDTNRRVLFDPNATWVPLGVFVALCGFISGGAVWAAQLQTKVDTILVEIRDKPNRAELNASMDNWRLRIQNANPTLVVPEFMQHR